MRDGDAVEAAAHAAAASGVKLLPIESSSASSAAQLLNQLWPLDPDGPGNARIIEADLLHAFAYTGNYVFGAFDGANLLGVSIGFFAANHDLHSHVTGVLPTVQGRGVGYALKLHQRAWAMTRGIARIRWTFDPLVRRSAWFNIERLGGLPTAFLPDFAGRLADRLLLTWELDSERAHNAIVGSLPLPKGELRVATPEDIAALRRTNKSAAEKQAAKFRADLTDALAKGFQVTGVGLDGAYVLEREQSDQPAQ